MTTYNANRQAIYINSKNKIQGSHSNFSYKINVGDAGDGRYDRVAVLSASIPKSFYIVNSDSTFQVQESGEVSGTLRTITISAGNYTRTSMLNRLTTLLNTGQAPALTYSIQYSQGSLSIYPDTGKYTFMVTGNISQPSFIFSSSNTLNECLGFESGSTDAFVAGSLTSVNVLNLSPEQTLFIRSNIAISPENILQEIYCSGTPSLTSVIYYSNDYIAYGKPLRFSNLATNNTYHFWLTNESGQEVSLHGVNMEIVLMVWSESSKPRIETLMEELVGLLRNGATPVPLDPSTAPAPN